MLQTCISKDDIHYVKDRSLEFLASGITSAIGEQCLTNAGALGVFPEPCLEAIAAGDGREIMKIDADIARMHGIRVSLSLLLDLCCMCELRKRIWPLPRVIIF